MKKKNPATLEERQEVLEYCLKCFKNKAYRISGLMRPDMDKDDILSEIKVRVWSAMIKKEYLTKTKPELIKIGYVTASNHISQLLRTRLSSKGKRVFVSIESEAVKLSISLLSERTIAAMTAPARTILSQTLENEAIGLVGLDDYEYLLKALRYNWNVERLTYIQSDILIRLDLSPEDMRSIVELLSKRVKRRIVPEGGHDALAARLEGTWVQNSEIPRLSVVF